MTEYYYFLRTPFVTITELLVSAANHPFWNHSTPPIINNTNYNNRTHAGAQSFWVHFCVVFSSSAPERGSPNE